MLGSDRSWDIIPGLTMEILCNQACYNAGHEIITFIELDFCRRIDV